MRNPGLDEPTPLALREMARGRGWRFLPSQSGYRGRPGYFRRVGNGPRESAGHFPRLGNGPRKVARCFCRMEKAAGEGREVSSRQGEA